ncbi:MAG TPA: hypothetical protein VGQ92_22380 [Actinoplanes sp.]|nr:hypothetical protein [Actinoplanes sp.]
MVTADQLIEQCRRRAHAMASLAMVQAHAPVMTDRERQALDLGVAVGVTAALDILGVINRD